MVILPPIIPAVFLWANITLTYMILVCLIVIQSRLLSLQVSEVGSTMVSIPHLSMLVQLILVVISLPLVLSDDCCKSIAAQVTVTTGVFNNCCNNCCRSIAVPVMTVSLILLILVSRLLNQPTNWNVRQLLHVNCSSGGDLSVNRNYLSSSGVDAVPAGSQLVATTTSGGAKRATTSQGAKQSSHVDRNPSHDGSAYHHDHHSYGQDYASVGGSSHSHDDHIFDDTSGGVGALDHEAGYQAIIPDVGRFRSQNQFLPFSTVSNNQERIQFSSDVLQKKSPFQHLLEDSIFDLGFVYEEGNTDFKASDFNGALTGLGELSLQHWKCGITTIHFLFPSVKQASNTCTAEGPHYQATFLGMVRTMEQYKASDI
jgi:hypothetical protein